MTYGGEEDESRGHKEEEKEKDDEECASPVAGRGGFSAGKNHRVALLPSDGCAFRRLTRISAVRGFPPASTDYGRTAVHTANVSSRGCVSLPERRRT